MRTVALATHRQPPLLRPRRVHVTRRGSPMGYQAMSTHLRIANLGRFWRLLITFLACQFVTGQELSKNRTDLLNLSQRNQNILVRCLRPALKATGGAGRLYVHSKCLGDSGNLLFFPRIELKSGSDEKAGSTAIQGVLAKNKDVKVSKRQPGLIGIWIGGVSNDLLNTRIHVLKLGPRQRYNYYDAIEAIISAKEVQAKMRELQMDEFTSFASYPILSPDPKLCHLPTSLSNLTMDEALDQVALAFGGLVIYKECGGQNPTRFFSVDFAGITDSPFKKGF